MSIGKIEQWYKEIIYKTWNLITADSADAISSSNFSNINKIVS